MTLQEAFLAYRLNVIAFRNQSRRTEEQHFLALKSLQKHIGNIDVSLLTFEHVRLWKERMQDERKSNNTIRGYIIKLRCVLNYLSKVGYNTLDVDLVPIPRRDNTVPSWLSPEEVQRLIDACPRVRAKAVISLLYASGIRVSELCALNRDQLHDGRFTIIGKGNKPRLCFYDDRAHKYITQYLSRRTDNHPALFIQRTNVTRLNRSGVEEMFQCIRKKAGFTKTVTPHTMRHSYATNLMQNGAAIHNVQRLLGHTNIQTTSMYLHTTDVRLEEEYSRFHTI